jgi:hypothetical protein
MGLFEDEAKKMADEAAAKARAGAQQQAEQNRSRGRFRRTCLVTSEIIRVMKTLMLVFTKTELRCEGDRRVGLWK